jgi:hypothetical protein
MAAPAPAQDVKAKPAGVHKLPGRPPDRAASRSVETDRTVTISADGRTIRVDPMYALVATKDPLEWRAGALPSGAELEIDFVSNDGLVGPFPLQAGKQNPRRGRYVLASGESHVTAPAERPGYWKYQVILRLPDGSEVSIDPGVIIKEGL